MHAVPATLLSLALLAPLVACNQPPAPRQPEPGQTEPRRTLPRQTSPEPNSIRRPRATSAPGFDFFLLNLSWSPEFCSTHPSAPECLKHPAFVLHGLWPQNTDGTYPEHCSTAPGPQDPAQYADLFPDPSLLRHEWSTHGTCSGLSPDAYFSLARSAIHSVTAPPALTALKQQTSEPPAQIIDQFALANPSIPRSSFAVSCGNNYLTAVEVCLDKQLHATTCESVRSCRAQTVRIVPPGAAN